MLCQGILSGQPPNIARPRRTLSARLCSPSCLATSPWPRRRAATRTPTTTRRWPPPSRRPRATLPKDKIKTAIDKAFGSGKDAASYEEVVYEGYGPAGVAVYCEALTDNRNRTAADVRAAFAHAGGNLGTSGSVAFQFDRKGQIMVSKEVETGDKKHPMGPNGAAADEEEFEMAVIEAGGDDYEDADEEWIVYTQPSDLMAVKKALEEQGVQVKGAEMTMEATTPATVTANDAKKVMRLVDKLEELEDLQNVYHTMDITEEIAAVLDE